MAQQWIVKQAGGGAGERKATFGLLRSLAVENDLTNHFICRTGGVFQTIAVNAKVAPVDAARLDIKKSTDEGASWSSILAGGFIELAPGDTTLQVFTNFLAAPNNAIAADDLLRIDCVQKGATVAGKQIEVVLRWG